MAKVEIKRGNRIYELQKEGRQSDVTATKKWWEQAQALACIGVSGLHGGLKSTLVNSPQPEELEECNTIEAQHGPTTVCYRIGGQGVL
jgi:hypothetical protein